MYHPLALIKESGLPRSASTDCHPDECQGRPDCDAEPLVRLPALLDE